MISNLESTYEYVNLKVLGILRRKKSGFVDAGFASQCNELFKSTGIGKFHIYPNRLKAIKCEVT